MASEGNAGILPRLHRPYLAALDAPHTVLVLAHDIDYRDYADRGLEERVSEAYHRIFAATLSCGFAEMGVPYPRGRKDPVTYAWGEDAAALIAQPDPPRPTGSLAPADIIAFRDDQQESFLVVDSDWDGCFPKHLLAWGPGAEACALAVESALSSYRERHPVPDEFI